MRRRARGFTYVGLIFIVALLGLAAAAASTLWSVAEQRDRERELLFVGRAYRNALERYRVAGSAASSASALSRPAGAASSAQGEGYYPASLDQLLVDPRVPFTRRFLRQLYPDPMTGKPTWGLLRDGHDGIVGIYSLSTRKPFKTGNFLDTEPFAGARNYRDWIFSPDPPTLAAAASR